MAENFETYLSYLWNVLQTLMDLIMSHWVTSVILGIQVLYLMINAIKLKKNTE